MDDHNQGRRRARWTTRALVAASLAATAGFTGVAVAEQHTAATTSAATASNADTTSGTNPSTPAAAPAVTAGTGSSHATTGGS
jgi:hypothetical protein